MAVLLTEEARSTWITQARDLYFWENGSSKANNGQGNALFIIASYTNIPLDNATYRRLGEKLLVFQYTNSECLTVDSIEGPVDPALGTYIFDDT